MSKIIKLLPNNIIEIIEYKSPNAVFNTNEYNSYETMCVLHETIDPFQMFYENKELKDRKDKAVEYIDSQSPDAGVSGKRIKKILKGDKE